MSTQKFRVQEGIVFPDGSEQTTAAAGSSSLTNGDYTVTLNSDGNLIVNGQIIIGGTDSNQESHLVIDAANYWTSIQWKNFNSPQDPGATPFECQAQLLRVFSGTNEVNGHEELVALTAVRPSETTYNGMMITTSDGKIPDAPYNDGVGTQHNFIFGGDGDLYIPNDIIAQPSNDLNLKVFSTTGNDGVTISLQNRNADTGSKTTQFNVGVNNIELTTDFQGAGNTWTFDNSGVLTLPVNGDIKDSNGNSVLGSGGSANLGNFKIQGSYLGTTDNPDTGNWGGYGMTIDSGGESGAGIFLPSIQSQNEGGTLNLYSNNGFYIGTGRGNIVLGTDMEAPGAPSHFHIAFDGSNNYANGNDLFLGDDYNYFRVQGSANGVSIGANNRDGGNQQVWTFDNSGDLTVPNDILANPNNDLNLKVFNPTISGGGVTISLQNRDADTGSKTTQFNVGANDIELTTDFSGGAKTWTFNKAGHIVPGSDNLQDIGTPTNRVRHIYVGPGSITVGDSIISESTTGKLVIPGLTRGTGYSVEEVDDTGDQSYVFGNAPTIIDAALYNALLNSQIDLSYFASFNTSLDGDGYLDNIQVTSSGSYPEAESVVARTNNMYAYIGQGDAGAKPAVPQEWVQIPFRPRMKAGDTEYEFNTGGGGSSSLEGLSDVNISDPQGGEVLIWDSNDEVWRNGSGGSSNLPSDATGYLHNDGSGNLTWDTSTADLGNLRIATWGYPGNNPVRLTHQTYGESILIQSTDYEGTNGRSSLRWHVRPEPDGSGSQYSQVDVQNDGVWIKNADWSGSGGTWYWHFDNNGILTLPQNGDIKDSNGNSVLGGGGNANTGNITFNFDTISATGDGDGYPLLINNQGSSGGVEIDYQDSDGNQRHAMWLNGEDGLNIRINSDGNGGDQADWKFSTDRRLTFPDGISSIYSSDTGIIRLSAPDSIVLNNSIGVWTFGSDAKLTLPENGDIVDSNGISVLGGAANLGDLTAQQNTIYATKNSSPSGFLNLNNEDNQVVIGSNNDMPFKISVNENATAREWTFDTWGMMYIPENGPDAGISGPNNMGKIYFTSAGDVHFVAGDTYEFSFNVNGSVTFGGGYTFPGNKGGDNQILVFDGVDTFNWADQQSGGGGGTSLPDQTDNGGKYLTTDGSGNLSWADVSYTGGNEFGYITLTNNGFVGEPYSFTHVYNQDSGDNIDTGLTIMRDQNGIIYNSEEEGSAGGNSPAGTEWNYDGWSDLTNVTSRNYMSFSEACSYAIGANVLQRDFVMHDTNNDKYYTVKFSAWGAHNNGGFAYTRRQIDVGMEHAGVVFADGTRQTTAYVPPSKIKGEWVSPNDNTWRIEEHTGGTAVSWDGTNAVQWWDPNEFATAANFRGGIVEYHAFVVNVGTVIGRVMIASDYDDQNRTHSEVTSGNNELGEIQFWANNGDKETIWLTGRNGQSRDVMIQWTAKLFYGSESNC